MPISRAALLFSKPLLIAGIIMGSTLALPADAANAPAKAPAKTALSPGRTNWTAQIAVTANGSHRYGNPEAPVRLVEFVSYTCPHCAHFHKEAEPALRMTGVAKGQVSVTVTNLLRNSLDLTVAMLTNCGNPNRFFARHDAFFASQEQWLTKAQNATREQQQRWNQGTPTNRMRAIANDLGFYPMMERWGISRTQVDTCLADNAMIQKLTAQTHEAQALGIMGTPSFTINGQLIDAHDWDGVSKLLNAKIAEQRAGNI